jgi:hypothetical protein
MHVARGLAGTLDRHDLCCRRAGGRQGHVPSRGKRGTRHEAGSIDGRRPPGVGCSGGGAVSLRRETECDGHRRRRWGADRRGAGACGLPMDGEERSRLGGCLSRVRSWHCARAGGCSAQCWGCQTGDGRCRGTTDQRDAASG